MEWTESIKSAINYMESHILDNISAEDVAKKVHMSSFYLQKGFKIMTDYTIGEYIRYRRLYLAALDVIADNEKVIDLACKYGYDTPESFTRAFRRFHGVSPMQMKGDSSRIRIFLPLKISIVIQGGNDMDYTVEKISGFKVIGFGKIFSYDSAYAEIPKFWDEFRERYVTPLTHSGQPKNDVEKIICSCEIGEYGVCIDDVGDGKFRYLIAGTYHGGYIPEGMTVFEFPDIEWAKFRCVGSLPGALQSMNTRVFREWLPGNPDYLIGMGANVEWYSQGDMSAPDYESGIWVPVVRKYKG